MTAAHAFADIADDFAELDAPPAFVIEPRDRDAASEADRQRRFLAMLKSRAPAVMVMAFSNAGRRSDWEAVQRWKEGQAKGAPDLWIGWNYGHCFLEFKSGTGKPTPAQVRLLNRLVSLGHRCAVVRTPEFALGLLAEWGGCL